MTNVNTHFVSSAQFKSVVEWLEFASKTIQIKKNLELANNVVIDAI